MNTRERGDRFDQEKLCGLVARAISKGETETTLSRKSSRYVEKNEKVAEFPFPWEKISARGCEYVGESFAEVTKNEDKERKTTGGIGITYSGESMFSFLTSFWPLTNNVDFSLIRFDFHRPYRYIRTRITLVRLFSLN